MKRRGLTFIELTVALALLTIVLSGLFTIFVSISGVQKFTSTMPTVQDYAQKMTLDVAGAIRKATLATSLDSTCTKDAAVESATSTALTVYTGTTGSITKVTYANSGANVNKSDSLWYSNASLSFTYYQSSTSAYHLASGSGLTAYTPSSSTTKNLVAVKVTGTYTSNGLTATYSTMVRLRNGPLRTVSND
jgi:prepilin-type N-terminal cleavage/methylation domain-containing protein